MTYDNLGLFVNRLAADNTYSLCDSENLRQTYQKQLPKKQKTFSQFFAPFLKTTSNSQNFERKDGPHCLCISKITNYQIRAQINV